MSRFAQRAEILKLARLLRQDERDLRPLQSIDTAGIRALRERISARLFDADEKRLRRVAIGSRLLPASLNALLAEKVFGPLLCARIAGMIAPERAADVAQRLSVDFLADVTQEIDPRQVREILVLIPVPLLAAVAMILSQRGDFMTVAQFIDDLSLEAIAAVIERLSDDAALLQIAFFVEDRQRLECIVEVLPETRLRAIIQLATDASLKLWPEALSLMSDVSPGLRKRLAQFAASMEDAVLTGMVRATQAGNLWGSMLPVIDCMDLPSRIRLLHLPVLRDAAVLDAILAAAQADDLWPLLVPLITQLDDTAQADMARAAERLSNEGLVQLLHALRASGILDSAHTLLNQLPPKLRERLQARMRTLMPDPTGGGPGS